jgi:hypothetical protein
MGPTMCVLAAGLFVGQAQEMTTQKPSCNCQASTSSGWTTTPNQSRSWTQTGSSMPATGWTWRTTVNEGPQDDSFVSRLSERLNAMFGSRPTTSAPMNNEPQGEIRAAEESYEAKGWIEDGDDAFGPIEQGAGWPAPSSKRLPAGKVTTNEPPLLEAYAAAPALTVQAVAPTQEPQVVIPVVNRTKLEAGNASKIGHADDYSALTGQLEVANGVYHINYAAPGAIDRFGGRMILSGPIDLTRYHHGDIVRVRGGVLNGHAPSGYYAEAIERVE